MKFWYYNIIFIIKTTTNNNNNKRFIMDSCYLKDLLEEAEYEKQNFINTIKRRIRMYDESEKECIYTIRPMYLYLIRRRKWLYKYPDTYTHPSFEKVAYNKCIELIPEIKKKIKKLENKYEIRKLWKYYKLSLTTLRKYAKLHTYIYVIITLSIQKKLNGNNDVCRHILSYM